MGCCVRRRWPARTCARPRQPSTRVPWTRSRGDDRPRTVIWVGGRGVAETAGSMLAATSSGLADAPIVIAAEAPPWIGPLDVVIVAGDVSGDPALVGAAASGVRRGSRIVVAAPYEGSLRDITAGRVAVMEPRLPVDGESGLCRYLAIGLAALQSVDPRLQVDLAAMADELTPKRCATAPAGKCSPIRPRRWSSECRAPGRAGRRLRCDRGAGPARVRCSVAHRARGGSCHWAGGRLDRDAGRDGFGFANPTEALFHDDEIDGPIAERLRVLALTLDAERTVVAARVAGLDDVDIVGAEDVPDLPDGRRALPGARRIEQQLAILAVRLEMAAVYLRLVRG